MRHMASASGISGNKSAMDASPRSMPVFLTRPNHARAARALWISAETRRSYSAHLLLGGAARPCLRLGLLWRFASSSAS